MSILGFSLPLKTGNENFKEGGKKKMGILWKFPTKKEEGEFERNRSEKSK